MKKIALLTAGIAAIMMTACQKDDNVLEQQNTFTVTATIPQKADTRVALTEVAGDPLSSLKVTWAEGDAIMDENGDLYRLDTGAGTTSGTFIFESEPTEGTKFTYGEWHRSQAQDPSDTMSDLSAVHVMAGTYNTTTQSIAFEHQTSVMRIALSGLLKSSSLVRLYIEYGEEYINLNLNDYNNSTTDEGTFVAWASIAPTALDGITELTFKLEYLDTSTPQIYTHTFSSALVGDNVKGKLLHCNINMNAAAEKAREDFLAWYNGSRNTDFTLTSDITLQSGDITSVQDLDESITFDGGGHTIKGLELTKNYNPVGLFNTNYGTIKNVIVQGAKLNGGSVGVIAATNSSVIIGCQTIDCELTSSNGYIGGIANNNRGTIVACYESGSTIDGSTAGGIVGYHNTGTILACYAQPATVTGDYSGAVVGVNTSGTTTACYWQHATLSKGVGSGTDTTTKSNYADCYATMNTALASSAAAGVVSWGTTGLVYAD
ncbi:hypothetical protein D0T50_05525 [Bacteroides sp. 214]|uniref:hypothetical protein n=1 Tax=Bacteroides sp. 214 TaxID=2302935 RepID=UPI0013D7B392|nr:hypothetical protein [Bacteroides sp. 214]NDW12349.1 hypothetical protein [Bacteroides sp. 214]